MVSHIPEFRCFGVRVHFIYSFCLKDKEGFLVEPSEFLQRVTAEPAKAGRPSSRQGIVPHLSFKSEDEACYVEFPEEAGKFNGRTNVRVRRVVRVFPGGGCCTISITVKSRKIGAQNGGGESEGGITTSTILSIIDLAPQRTDTKRRELRIGNQVLYDLYGYFVQTLDHLISEDTDMLWLERDMELLATDPPVQSPWVVTVAEAGPKVTATFCASASVGDDPAREKMIRMRVYEHQIAPILFRSIKSTDFSLEPAYMEPPYAGGVPGLYNMNVDARTYVRLSRRSTFCVCNNADEHPACYFLAGLLDLSELVRARWHGLIVLNRVLDKTTKKMLELMREPSSTTDSRTLLTIVHLREWLAYAAGSPGLYTFAGDALAKIYVEMSNAFRLSELRSLLLEKIQLIDHLHRDIVNLKWLDRVGGPEV